MKENEKKQKIIKYSRMEYMKLEEIEIGTVIMQFTGIGNLDFEMKSQK